MCGIVGYIGQNDIARSVVIEGLTRLEYRGYDSAGISIKNKDGSFDVFKTIGGVDNLYEILPENLEAGNIAIGHTRWATHGAPSEANAHPHVSMHGTISLVHNGIIENYETLKTQLVKEGYVFKSETDSEVLVNWIEFHYNRNYSEHENDLSNAIRLALRDVVGAYAILVTETHYNQMIAVRKSSPLCIGISDGEYVVASDATPIIEHTRDVIYLEDDQMAVISLDGGLADNPDIHILDVENQTVPLDVEKVTMELESIEKGGYDTFMLKEIFEQPNAISNTIRGRLTLIGKTIIETLCRIPVEVDYASEFRYRKPIIKQGDVLMSISQSGETADTKAAMEMAKEKGATLFGIVNVVGSSIARMSDSGIYTHSGTEIGVASTKAFTGQLAAVTLIAIKMAKQLGSITNENYADLKRSLALIPKKMSAVLLQKEEIFKIADEYSKPEYRDFLYLGRGINFPIALEGALKLKEVSYVHAEGYPAGEMKHGPIALVDENCPSVFIAPTDKSYDKVLSNMQEIKARGGKVIAIVTEGDAAMSKVADHVIEIPKTDDLLTPMLTCIPLQLLSYRIAVNLGKNVDKPRNLAKSVTVE